MEVLSNCPVCGHAVFRDFIHGRDYFFSKDEFTIVACEKCGFRFTNPRPDPSEISKYYDSDEYISHNAQKQDILNSVYRRVRTYSIRRKYLLIKRYCEGNSLLD